MLREADNVHLIELNYIKRVDNSLTLDATDFSL